MWGGARRRSDCKNEATLKKGGKKQAHLQNDHSEAYTKEKVSLPHSAAVAIEHTPSFASDTFLPSSQVFSETSGARSQVCLKDLCPEDKRRIANLIEELARVSEEKEESVQRLKDEQENFERKIHQLEQQNVIIAQERESMQQQYRECQELLGLYQQYLSQQQAKLNESIAQLSQAPAHSKVLSEEARSRTSTSRGNGSLYDGSYLRAVQTLGNPTSLSCVSEFSPSDGPINQHRIYKRECREPHPEPCHRYEHCQGSGQDSGYGTQQRRRDNSSHLENGHHDTLNQHESLTRPLLGHEDWEEKRHQLLLQKMQLEMERERLQARLDEQEERLNRQKQQLCQSRLDHKALERSRRDMATSPAKSPVSLTTKTLQSFTYFFRLDFSVVELLDVFSPVSAPEQSKLSTRRTKTTQRRPALATPKPVGRTLLAPSRPYLQSTQQDLEESQILEDIFFIC
uniref:Zgc:162344 n=1 Tax=Seriola dumerili TaxID=41447 RepID=A0A3B4VKG4_SERDU